MSKYVLNVFFISRGPSAVTLSSRLLYTHAARKQGIFPSDLGVIITRSTRLCSHFYHRSTRSREGAALLALVSHAPDGKIRFSIFSQQTHQLLCRAFAPLAGATPGRPKTKNPHRGGVQVDGSSAHIGDATMVREESAKVTSSRWRCAPEGI